MAYQEHSTFYIRIVPTSSRTYTLDCRTKGVEEPVIRVDLILILLLEAEESLYWGNAFLGAFYFH
jgi:hypothetical protein